MTLTVFLAWYAFGWWFTAHSWRKEFNLTLTDAIFFSILCAPFGPVAGWCWMLARWWDRRPKKPRVQKPYKPRKPIIVLRKY